MRAGVCLCVTESIFCTPETTSTVNQLFCNKQLYKSINKIKLNSGTENRLVVAKGGGWSWEKWVKRVKIYELPVKK